MIQPPHDMQALPLWATSDTVVQHKQRLPPSFRTTLKRLSFANRNTISRVSMATIDAIMSVGSLSAEKEEVFMPFASRNARGILGLAIILAAIGGTTGAAQTPN